MTKNIGAALTAILAFAACSGVHQTVDVGGEWEVVQIDTMHITPEKDVTPFFGFNARTGDFYGFTGCNRLTGRLEKSKLSEGHLDFSNVGCTRMLCHDALYERPLLDAMQRVNKASVSGDTLRLTAPGGKATIILKKR